MKDDELTPAKFDDLLGYLVGHEISDAAEKLSRYAKRIETENLLLAMKLRQFEEDRIGTVVIAGRAFKAEILNRNSMRLYDDECAFNFISELIDQRARVAVQTERAQMTDVVFVRAERSVETDAVTVEYYRNGRGFR